MFTTNKIKNSPYHKYPIKIQIFQTVLIVFYSCFVPAAIKLRP